MTGSAGFVMFVGLLHFWNGQVLLLLLLLLLLKVNPTPPLLPCDKGVGDYHY
jgi:hypothetical protein